MYSTSLIFISCQQQNQKFNLNFLLDPNCGLIKITLYNNLPPPFSETKKLSNPVPLLPFTSVFEREAPFSKISDTGHQEYWSFRDFSGSFVL